MAPILRAARKVGDASGVSGPMGDGGREGTRTPDPYHESVPTPSKRALAAVVLAALLLAAVVIAWRPPSGVALRYVAIGASDTVGAGVANPLEEGWVSVLHDALPDGTQLLNLGVNGMRLEEALAQSVPVALDARPDVVTVWLAANDLNSGVPLADYQRDLGLLLNALDGTGARWILVGNLPDLVTLDVFGRRAGTPDQVRAELALWNKAIATAVADHHASLVDVFAASSAYADHPEYVSFDGGHPSAAGYARLAEIFGAALRDAGGPVDGLGG